MSSRVAEIQVLLEGVPLPAGKRELLDHARREGAGPGELALLEALPDREYGSLDEVGETLYPVQPVSRPKQPDRPKPESGLPPGGEAYTDPSAEPGAVRDLVD
jgi:hypothetical protein